MADQFKMQMNNLVVQLKVQMNKFAEWMKNIPELIKNLPAIVKAMSQEELIAYGAIILGLILILLAIILW